MKSEHLSYSLFAFYTSYFLKITEDKNCKNLKCKKKTISTFRIWNRQMKIKVTEGMKMKKIKNPNFILQCVCTISVFLSRKCNLKWPVSRKIFANMRCINDGYISNITCWKAPWCNFAWCLYLEPCSIWMVLSLK